MHSFNTCYVLSSTLGDTKTKNYKAPPPVRGHCVGLGPPLAGRIGCRARPCSPCSNALAADGYTVTRTSKHSCHRAEKSLLVTGAPCPLGLRCRAALLGALSPGCERAVRRAAPCQHPGVQARRGELKHPAQGQGSGKAQLLFQKVCFGENVTQGRFSNSASRMLHTRHAS